MSWRPDGWKNPYPDKPDDYNYDQEDDVRPAVSRELCKEAYEFSADAILEALKKEGTNIKERHSYCCPCGVCLNGEDCQATDNGWLVFIPKVKKVAKVS